MIKINLLDSITDKPIGAGTFVERKVSNPMSRFVVLAAVVGFLTLVAIAGNYFYAAHRQASAQRELDTQKQIAAQMEAVIKEQADLEQKIKGIDDRINAIKQLRASQSGPSAVLDALSERIAATPGLYLKTVEQKGNQFTIEGNSPNEYAVTQFGQSLEFSGGLFSGLSIDIKRDTIDATQVGNNQPAPVAVKPETINFVITCAYTPPQPETPVTQQATNVAPAGTPGTTVPPVAANQPSGVPPVAPPAQQPTQVAQK